MSAAGGDPHPPGRRLGPYEILDALGAGGMGVVYRARDTRLGRDVALKFLPSQLSDSEAARERLRREARAVAALQHPNICAIYDVGEEEQGGFFLVMELLAGETLQQRLARGVLPLNEALDIAGQLASALVTAHGAGILHRDIKPGNIFLTDHGPKMLDFGLAKAIGPASPDQATAALLTAPGDVVGTAAYMSPEQLRGEELDGRSDVFSLGLVLYEMVTGARAFAGKTAAAITAAILHESPPPVRSLNAAVPQPIEACILRAIEKPRDLRFQSAADLRSALLHARSTSTVAVAAGPRTRRWPWAVVAAAVVVAAIAAAMYLRRPAAPPLTDRDTIVIADFHNTTGDAVFDDTLRQGLSVQLQQSPFVTLLSDARVRRTLTLMGRSADDPLSGPVAAEVCERTGCAAFLEGSIAPLGTRYVLGLKATSCQDGEVLDEGQVQVDRKEDVLRAIDELAAGFRQRSGESLTSRQRFAVPLDEATTSSLDALKAYSVGRRLNYASGLPAAITPWKRAVEIDPAFGAAWAMLGLAYNTVGETALSVEAATKAYDLRARTTDHERFLIEALYERQVTGDLDKARQIFESWVTTYPRDVDAHGLLAGFSTHGTGRYEQAIAESDKALALDPDFAYGFANLISANLYLDRVSDADRAVEQALAHKVEMPDVLLLRYALSFLKGDGDAMARDALTLRNQPQMADRITSLESLVAAREGRLGEARVGFQRATTLAEQSGLKGLAATYAGIRAMVDALAGDAAATRTAANHALQLSDGRDVTYAAAFALARIGDRARAAELTASLATRFPKDTSVRYNYLPALRALDALQSRDPNKALAVLEEARPYELAVPSLAFLHFIGALYPPFLRGEAYLALNRNDEAAVEFRKILAHRGLLLADPIGPITERKLAELGKK
jgi:eukaryotic-like serine/threonine-protein kinase